MTNTSIGPGKLTVASELVSSDRAPCNLVHVNERFLTSLKTVVTIFYVICVLLSNLPIL